LKLSDLSTAELINLVKRGITGTTAAPPSDFPREVIIALAGANNSPRRVKLIKGGRHIVVARTISLEIWDVATQKLVWSRSIGHNLSVDYSHSAVLAFSTLLACYFFLGSESKFLCSLFL
jgi:hypothetical protein